MERLYSLIWQDFCSDYMEIVKMVRVGAGADPSGRAAAAAAAVGTLDALLRILHPFMPFVTEECAQRLPAPAPSLQHRSWPAVDPAWDDPAGAAMRAGVDELLDLVRLLRARRQEAGISASDKTRHEVVVRGGATALSPGTGAGSWRPWSRSPWLPREMIAAQVVVAGTLEAELRLGAGATKSVSGVRSQSSMLVSLSFARSSPTRCSWSALPPVWSRAGVPGSASWSSRSRPSAAV